MSLEAMTWAFKLTIPANEKLLLLCLADFADDQWYCFPGQQILAERTSMSVATIRRLTEKLRERELVNPQMRYTGKGKRTSNGYYLTPEKPALNLSGSQVTTAQSGVTTAQIGADYRSSVSANEPPVEPPVKESLSTTLETPDAFEQFWTVYPRRIYVNNARLNWAEYVTKAGVDPASVIRGAEVYADELRHDQTEERFIKAPAAWLEGGGWMNYDTTPQPPRKKLDSERTPEEIAVDREAFIEAHRNDEPIWKQRQRMLATPIPEGPADV